MATVYSDQITKNDQTVPRKYNDANTRGASVKLFFSYTTPASSAPAVGDYIELVKIPDNARVVGGKVVAEAMSSGAGTAGVSIGYSGADTRYGSALNIDAAATVEFANTIALNFGDVVSGETTLRALVTGEALAVSKKLYGYIEVLLP